MSQDLRARTPVFCPWCGIHQPEALSARRVSDKGGVLVPPHDPCTLNWWHVQAHDTPRHLQGQQPDQGGGG